MKKWYFPLAFLSFVLFVGVCNECNSSQPTYTEEKADANEQYFSNWDGSNVELVEAVKAKMNDPDSFEHVETGWKDDQDGTLFLKMIFRGKNGFGGVITSSATAVFNKDTREISKVTISK